MKNTATKSAKKIMCEDPSQLIGKIETIFGISMASWILQEKDKDLDDFVDVEDVLKIENHVLQIVPTEENSSTTLPLMTSTVLQMPMPASPVDTDKESENCPVM